MKKINLVLVLLSVGLSFISCSDYDDTLLKSELEKLKSESDELSRENDSLKHKDDCIIKSFYFTAVNNSSILNQNVYGIINDSIINVRIPNICLDKQLIPTIEFFNDNSFIESPSDSYNFNSPVIITTSNGLGKKRNYIINVSSYTGLPMIFLYTKGGLLLTQKTIMLGGHCRFIPISV